MNLSIDNLALIILVIIAGGLLMAVVRLLKISACLKRDIRSLQDDLVRQNRDIAGLCQAGIGLDRRMADHDNQIAQLLEKLACIETQDQANQSYHAAIPDVRKGMNAGHLAERYGMMRAEAELLIRLHGPRPVAKTPSMEYSSE